MNIQIFHHREDFYKSAKEVIAPVINDGGHIALSGGNTPLPINHLLASDEHIDFSEASFYQVDERYIPESHDASNAHMIRNSLFEEKQPKMFLCFATQKHISDAVNIYEKRIHGIVFDLVVLGMGEDGHIASLFPHSPALQEELSDVAHTTTDKFKVRDRLTLTLPPLLRAKKILLLICGKEKKKAVQELLFGEKDFMEFPAKALLVHSHLHIYYSTV